MGAYLISYDHVTCKMTKVVDHFSSYNSAGLYYCSSDCDDEERNEALKVNKGHKGSSQDITNQIEGTNLDGQLNLASLGQILTHQVMTWQIT